MSGPVDVLAVLALHGRRQTNGRDEYPRLSANDELQQAHDAVAELIEAATPFAARNSSDGMTFNVSSEQVARLRSALANVGSAA